MKKVKKKAAGEEMETAQKQIVSVDVAKAIFRKNSGYSIPSEIVEKLMRVCEEIREPFTGELVVKLAQTKATYPRFQWDSLPDLIRVYAEFPLITAMSVEDLKILLVKKGIKPGKRSKLFKEMGLPKTGMLLAETCRDVIFRAMMFKNVDTFSPRAPKETA